MAGTMLLNPLTPMAHLVPTVAYRTTMASYITVGTTGAILWDILIHIDSDYKILFKNKLSLATALYFLSRECVLGLSLLETVMQTTSLPDCSIFQRTITGMYITSFSLTSLVACCQISTFFFKNYSTGAIFLVSWLGVLGGGIAFATTVSPATFIGPTTYCIHGFLGAAVNAAPITFAVSNTFILLALTYQRLSSAPSSGGPSIVAKETLQLLVIMCNWSIVIASALFRGTPAYWFSFTVLNVAFTNFIVCRVYRATTLGESFGGAFLRSSTALGSIQFASNPTRSTAPKSTDFGSSSSQDVMDISSPVS